MLQILILIAVLISYGSIYPFEFAARELSTQQFVAFLTALYGPTSLGNVIANIVLFVPYGFIAPLALRGRSSGWWELPLIAALGLVLAVALQIVQLWIPGRVPAMGDALLNLAGILVGLGLGVPFERHFDRGTNPALTMMTLAPLLLALAWVAYRWFPLVPTIDLQNVKNALKPLLQRHIDPVRVVHDVVAWLAFFRLLAFTPARALAPPWLGAGAVAIVALQPLFVGNAVSANNVAGLALALACLPLLSKHFASALVVAAIFVVLALTALHPFTLTTLPNTFHWIPFTGYLDGSMATNALNLLHKSFLYGTAVFLLRDCGSRPLASALTVAMWLALLEAAQIWIVGRTAEITDPLYALMLAWIISRLGTASPAVGARSHRRLHDSSPRIRSAQSGSPST
ncbi:MAG TPA: VanZ family protein [Rhodocyclaceae bacterium]|nr:VanZ family protein [Rhodocyclaceae bacterium]